METSLNQLLSMFMIFAIYTDGKNDDYHPSSSAAFDEGKLSSISRFYPIGSLSILLLLLYSNIKALHNTYDITVNFDFIS